MPALHLCLVGVGLLFTLILEGLQWSPLSLQHVHECMTATSGCYAPEAGHIDRRGPLVLPGKLVEVTASRQVDVLSGGVRSLDLRDKDLGATQPRSVASADLSK